MAFPAPARAMSPGAGYARWPGSIASRARTSPGPRPLPSALASL